MQTLNSSWAHGLMGLAMCLFYFMRLSMNKKIKNIFDICSVVFGVIFAYTGFLYYLDNAQCLQYNIIGSYCISNSRQSSLLELIILVLNILNINRLINEYRKQ